MNHVAIVGNGTLDTNVLAEISRADVVIGVDRGAYWLIAKGTIPDIAIGDFDSVNARERTIIKKKVKKVKEYPKEKDFTDMELAVERAIALHPTEVVIYGAVGNRLDHTMGNIQLLERLLGFGVIRDSHNEVRLVSDRLVLQKEPRYPYVSLLPITETVEVTLTGFVYDISNTIIRRGQTLGVSNEIRGEEAIIEIHHGKALVIRSRD